MKTEFKIKIVILLIIFFFINIVFAEEKENYLEILREGNSISAEINEVDIEKVFKQISEKFNFQYKILPEMQKKIVSTRFKNLSLIAAIETIVRDNYILDMDDGRIKKIYLVNRSDKDFINRNGYIQSFIKKQPLSLDQLKDIVTKNISKEYPHAKLFTIIPHEDIKGNLRSYIFSYYINQGIMPSIEKVKSDINNAWEFKKEARKHITEAYKTQDSSMIIEWLEKLKPYDYKLRQSQDYISLEIAADYDAPPVKKFYSGLPYDLAMYPNAVELLERKLKDLQGIEFKKTFIIDLLAIGFEFKDVTTNKSYYVDVLNNAVFDRWEEKAKTDKEKGIDNERKNIKKQWEEFLS